jgi:GT2 family glycosyltransferase
MSDRSVSIAIPSLNAERHLPGCLDALRAQARPPAEVIVVDNGSADGTRAMLAERYPEVQLVALERNYGFAGGSNRGVAAASSPLVCVLNSDARPRPDWLERLLAAPAPDEVWAWGSVLVSSSDGRVESAGDHWSDEGFAYKLGRGLDVADLPSEPYEVFSPPGAAPLFRRDRFEALGGYHERFFIYYCDVDLAYRALLRGWRALLVPSARVEHDLGSAGVAATVRFRVARNSLWTAVRCVPEPNRRLIARRVVTELLGNRPRRLAHRDLAGRLAALAGMPRTLRERRAVQESRTLSAAEVRERLRVPAALAPRPAR